MSGRPPHILVSTGIYPNRADPTRGVYVARQVTALSRRCPLRVVAPVRWVPAPLRRGRYARLAGVPRRDRIDGVDVTYPRYVVAPRIGRHFHGAMLDVCVWREHARVAREASPDVVLGYFAWPYGYAAVMAARRLGLPALVSCRGSDINHLARPPRTRMRIAWALAHCARVLVVSRALGERVAELGVDPARIVHVPNGIDRERFAPGPAPEAREALGFEPDVPLVVCVARLSREKGVDVLVEAFSDLAARDARARLAIVGDGPEREALRAQVARAGLSGRVHLAGTRPHDEVPRWMQAADVVVLPSRTEGHPNVVLEALACGRPVVATAAGGVPEILDATRGHVVPVEDPRALADALSDALGRVWDVGRLREAASRTWDDTGRQVAQIVAEVTAEARRRGRKTA